MHEALKKEGIGNAVMEVFSQPGVKGMAERLGIMRGLSLDLTGIDKVDGQPWDFNMRAKRDKAMDIVLGKQALLLIGSPMCKSFSKLMNWNWKRMDPIKQEQMIKELQSKFKLNAVPRFEWDATLIDGKEPQGIWISSHPRRKESCCHRPCHPEEAAAPEALVAVATCCKLHSR